jgi:hypothetical protein
LCLVATEEQKNKLDVAKECVMTLLDNLQPTDAFGLVAFDDVHTFQSIISSAA